MDIAQPVAAYGGIWGTSPPENQGDVPPPWKLRGWLPLDGNMKVCPTFEKTEKISNQLSSFSQHINDLNLKQLKIQGGTFEIILSGTPRKDSPPWEFF